MCVLLTILLCWQLPGDLSNLSEADIEYIKNIDLDKLRIDLARVQPVFSSRILTLEKSNRNFDGFRDELELSREQVEKVREFLAEKGNIRTGDNLLFGPRKVQYYESQIRQIDEFIDGLLLGHQKLRLAQLHRQLTRPRYQPVPERGGEGTVRVDGFELIPAFAEELGLTPEEKAKVVERMKVLREEFNAEDAKLLEKAKEAVRNSLTDEQRTIVEKGLGAPFDFERFEKDRY